MFISLTDNGGRRVKGDRRLVNQMNFEGDKRTGEDRRDLSNERRARKVATGERYERRAMPLFLASQKSF